MKNKKLFFSAVLCFLCAASVNLNAQIKVASTGKVSVAISDTVTPLSSLSVGSAGFANAGLGIQMTSTTVGSNSGWNNIYSKLLVTQLSPQWNTSISGATQSNGAGDRLVGVHDSGMKSSNSSNGRSYGVLGIAGRATSGYNYGICGFIQSGGGNGAAVYGSVTSYGEGNVPGRYARLF